MTDNTAIKAKCYLSSISLIRLSRRPVHDHQAGVGNDVRYTKVGRGGRDGSSYGSSGPAYAGLDPDQAEILILGGGYYGFELRGQPTPQGPTLQRHLPQPRPEHHRCRRSFGIDFREELCKGAVYLETQKFTLDRKVCVRLQTGRAAISPWDVYQFARRKQRWNGRTFPSVAVATQARTNNGSVKS